MATTNNVKYLDKDGLTTLVGKYITGKTGSTYAVPENELATRADYITIDTNNQILTYGYTYKTGSLSTNTEQMKLGTITITDALKDTFLSTSDSKISADGKLSLYIKTNSGSPQLVINTNDSGKRTALDLTAFINPDDYIKSAVMSSDYVTKNYMSTNYIVLTTKPLTGQTSVNTLISTADMNTMTMTSTDVKNLFSS